MVSFEVKRSSFACLIVSLALLIVCSSIVLAEPSGWAIKQLTNNDFYDYNPKISGLNVFWVEYDDYNECTPLFFYNGSSTIKISDSIYEGSFEISGSSVIWKDVDDVNDLGPLFFYNGSTIIKLNNSCEEGTYGVSGPNAVFQRYDEVNDTEPVFLYSGSTITKLTDDGFYPKISGSSVYWVEYDEENMVTPLFLYNGSTVTKLGDNINLYDEKESYQISDSGAAWAEDIYGSDYKPLFFYNGTTSIKLSDNVDVYSIKVSGSNVAWSELDDVNWTYSIFLYNGSTTTKLTDKLLDGDYYEMSGSNVVWEQYDEVEDASPLYFYNGSTTAIITYNIDNPKISGSTVIWMDWNDVNYSYSLFAYDGLTIQKLADNIDDNIDFETCNISGSNVVWQHNDGNDSEIFLATQAVGLQVTLGPAEAVLAGAQWSVDDGNWLNSGDVVTGLSAGQHEVEYSAAIGWWAPESEMVTINDGMLTSISRNYTPQDGNIMVTLGPAEAVTAGAQWNVDGGAWQNSGAAVTGLSVGSHTVNFKAIDGWIAPSSESVTVDCSLTTSISRNYTPQPGSIQITLGPADAVTAGAQWNVDGGEWKNSEAAVTGLSPGPHTVNFKSVSGWITPASESVTVSSGSTTTISRNYTPQPGSIQVTLGPADAVSAGAQWNVDGGDWQNSEAAVTDLPPGSHTVNFKSITGWNAPASESVTVNGGSTTSIGRNYILQIGNLQVTLGPANAISAGAQWKIDNGAWQNGGAEVTNLPAGSHMVNFKSITGWITPPDQNVTINDGELTSKTGLYTRIAGNLQTKKCTVTAGNGLNENNITFSGMIDVLPADFIGSVKVEVGNVYQEEIPVSSFVVKKGKYTYTHKIPRNGQGGITSLVIDTNKHTFSLKTQKVALIGLHCPFGITFAIGSYQGVSTIYENIANGRKFISVQFMSGVEDYLQVQATKTWSHRTSDSLYVKGAIALANPLDPYRNLNLCKTGLDLTLEDQTFTIPASSFKYQGTSGLIFVCRNAVIPGGIANVKFDFRKGTFVIRIKNAKIKSKSGIVGLTMSMGGFNQIVNFNLDIGQTVYSKLAGDGTGDGTVNLDDLVLLSSSWLDIPAAPGLDTNGDNFIDFTDFAAVANNWQSTSNSF